VLLLREKPNTFQVESQGRLSANENDSHLDTLAGARVSDVKSHVKSFFHLFRLHMVVICAILIFNLWEKNV
jgi:hypothetical protein